MVVRISVLAFILSITGLASAQDYLSLGKTLAEDFFALRFDKVAALFDATMTQGLPASKLAEVRNQILGGTGAFKAITGTRLVEQQGFRVALITCQFEKAALDMSIAFDSNGRVAGLYFVPPRPAVDWSAPPYAAPGRFQERNVTIGTGEWQLPGVLSLPIGTGPFPAVVLVHGSGSNDADETLGPNKPFKDIALGLSSRGIAVLRYNKRTLQYGNRIANNLESFTVKEETIDDATAAAVLLSKMPEIDSGRIYVLGHSLGGMLAPRIAAGTREISGIVIMAGSTRPFDEIIVDQIKYLTGLDEKMTEEEEKQLRATEEAAREIQSPALVPSAVLTVLGAKVPGSYFLDLRNYNQAEVAAALKIPILVLQAERDYQVTLKDFDGWKKTLAGKANVTFKLYPGLTHLFMPSLTPGTGLGTPADYQKPQHVSESVIADIADWIVKQ